MDGDDDQNLKDESSSDDDGASDTSMVALAEEGDTETTQNESLSLATHSDHRQPSQEDRDAQWKAEIRAALDRTRDRQITNAANKTVVNTNLSPPTTTLSAARNGNSSSDYNRKRRVGAFAVNAPARGGRPAWSRPPQAVATDEFVQANSIPPEMRVVPQTQILDSSTILPEIRHNPPENHIPPELRTVLPGDERSVIASIPEDSVGRRDKGEKSCHGTIRRRKAYIGIATVCVVFVVAIAVGVLVSLHPDKTTSTNTTILNSTEFEGKCIEMKSLAHYVDPDFENLDEESQQTYLYLLENEDVPTLHEDLCSPINLARFWLASTDHVENYLSMPSNKLALAALYFHWKGSGNTTKWLKSSVECEWEGVACDGAGKIVEIDLKLASDENVGQMTLPTEIGLLTDLKSLRMRECGISGRVPMEIGALSNLVILDLYGNKGMTGTFPFDYVPALRELRFLSLSQNSKMEIQWPSSLLTWPNLEVLSTSRTSIDGIVTIPQDIGYLSNLRLLDLSYSDVYGTLNFLPSLRNLTFAALQSGSLNGTIPVDIGRAENLQWLLLSNNIGLQGPLPSEIGSLSRLSGLHLHFTSIANGEPLPSELFKLPSLRSFTAPPADDTIKIVLKENSSLECVDLSTSYLDGSIVSETSNGTCILHFEDGVAVEDEVRNLECNSMNRTTCECCAQFEINCGWDPLRLRGCPKALNVTRLAQNLEMDFVKEIANTYVYV